MVMSKEYINLLRISAIKMMGNCCKACGETDKKDLHVHHIIPVKSSQGRGSRARAWGALEIAYSDTGLVLCSYCHGLFHSRDTMIWLQEDKTEAFRRAMREDYLDNLPVYPKGKALIFKEL